MLRIASLRYDNTELQRRMKQVKQMRKSIISQKLNASRQFARSTDFMKCLTTVNMFSVYKYMELLIHNQ